MSPLKAAAIVFLLGATHAVGLRVTGTANPIRKVVTLMQDMQKEIEKEVEAEKALFEKFMCICTDYPSELKDTIEETTKASADLSGAVESETAEKTGLELEVKTHQTEKAEAEKDLAQATELRAKESAAYEADTASTKASLAGLAKAIPAIEKGGSALLQQSNLLPSLKTVISSTGAISAWQKDKVTAFLNSGESTGDSGEVLGILKTMQDDMTKSLADGEAAEKVAADGYAQLKSAKEEQIAVAASAIEAKEKRSGELAVSIVQNKDALEDALTRKADSEKMLNTLVTTCGDRQKEWEAHFKTRSDEISAISETIAILNDDDALDIFKKAVPSLLQGPGARTGLLQTRRDAFQALETLRLTVRRNRAAQEHRLSSQSRVAQKVAASEPEPESELEKIPGHMIENLEKEDEDDAKKKEFCTAEITKAEGAEKAKQDALDALDAEVEQITDEVAGIDDAVKAIEKEIAEIDRSVALATEERKKEHTEYAESLTMADAAVALLGKAKNRLNKFYNPTIYKAPPKKEMTMEEKIMAAGGASFVQRAERKQMPELPTVPTFEKKNSGGVIAMIDKLSQDLVMDKAESEHDEKTAQKDYVELMKESGDSRAASEKSVVEKQASKSTLETRLLEAKESKKATFMELTNAHELTEQLHKTCDFLLQNFEERHAARIAEEDKLKAAKQVLHDSPAA